MYIVYFKVSFFLYYSRKNRMLSGKIKYNTVAKRLPEARPHHQKMLKMLWNHKSIPNYYAFLSVCTLKAIARAEF